MSVRDLTAGQLDVIFHAWLGEAAADFDADARLAAWRPSVDAMLARLRSTSAAPLPPAATAATTPAPTLGELDRAVEAAVRALGWALSAVEQGARAQGQTARAAQVAQALSFVFDHGMRFLSVPLHEQVGETRRTVALARHETVAALMDGTRIAGMDWAGLVSVAEHANAALEAALTREATVVEKGPSARAVRIEALRLANLVAQTAEAVLPRDVADRFLTVFRREVARAAARRAQPTTLGGTARAGDNPPPADDNGQS